MIHRRLITRDHRGNNELLDEIEDNYGIKIKTRHHLSF